MLYVCMYICIGRVRASIDAEPAWVSAYSDKLLLDTHTYYGSL